MAAGSTLALRPSPAAPAPNKSYLELLLWRRAELELLLIGFGDEVDRLRVAGSSPAVRRLGCVRRAEMRASQALERLEWVIADTPAETIGDVGMKLSLLTALQGYAQGVTTGWRAPFTVEEQLLRTMMADLERLKSARRERAPF